MGLLSSAMSETRGLSVKDRLIKKAFGLLPNNASGKRVDEQTAITLTAVYSATKIISETLASLPLKVYENRDDGGRRELRSHHLWSLLHDSPNDIWDSYQFREFSEANLLLRGNMGAQIIRDGAARPRELWPIPYKYVTPKTMGREIQFKVDVPESASPTGDKIQKVLPGRDFLFIPGLSFNGIEGLNPIEASENALGLGLAAEEHGASFLKNNAVPDGALQHPKKLGDDAEENLRKSINKRHKGSENSGRYMILEEGMEWQEIGITPEAAQLIETRKYQVREVARMFNIPPHMIGDLDDATFSNIETQSLEFVKFTMRPWLTRWENALNDQLVSPNSRGDVFIEFNVEGLLRGDSETRSSYYAEALQNGWMNQNEVRRRENLNPIEGGDKHFVNGNLQQLGTSPPDEEDGGQRSETRSMELRSAQSRRRFMFRFMSILENRLQTVIEREVDELRQRLEDGGTERIANDIEKFYFNEWPDEVRLAVEQTLRNFSQAIIEEASTEGSVDVSVSDVDDFIDSYVDGFVNRYCSSSRLQVAEMLGLDPSTEGRAKTPSSWEDPDDTGREVLLDRLNRWEDERAAFRAQQDSVRLTGAMSREVWSAGGIQTISWTAPPDVESPHSRALDGQSTSIDRPFVESGKEFQPDGAGFSIEVNRDINHPPIDQSDTATIEPG